MASANKRVEARKRAREVKARVDAQRAKQEKEISKVQTAFFVATADRDEAQESVAAAEQRMADAVRELSDDHDVSVDELAALCELSATDVRALKKRATPASATMEASTGDDEGGAAA